MIEDQLLAGGVVLLMGVVAYLMVKLIRKVSKN
ncbi:hypothetical protein IC006_2472 [Sulfuracidifex tepidarius]|uniref:Uncharacterized protein n=1 Tax=Sulfuracidifex tepidarius TaxID=1294262 RepID=A0A510DY67_9CREN|nr:hypothetical protein IC006_2472 [Sulfuracidifex tepidarius]BBG27924.1 hypothetical protein IC007_2479 [Sulfuracidifex tepidarius]